MSRAPRDAMQDVEVVDVTAGAPGDGRRRADPGLHPGADPDADAVHAARVARRRRAALRWWPLPVVLVAAVAGTQLVLDARERDRVAVRQEVEGVLRDVDPRLPVGRVLDGDLAAVSMTGLDAGDLRIGVTTPPWDDARDLIAVGADGATVWSTSLEDAGAAAPDIGLEYPSCDGGAPPVTTVRCLVLDRSASDPAASDDRWTAGPPAAARLVSVDAASGEVRSSRPVPPMSSWAGGGGLQVLASVVAGTLEVTAWDVRAAPDAPDDPDATPLWRTTEPLDRGTGSEQTAYPPTVFADAGRVVVQGDIGGWAFDAADGTRQVGGTDYLVVTRTGHLAASGAGLVVLDDTGAELFPLAGQPIYLGVDDGSAPDTELLITSRPGEGRLLTAVQVPSGDELWSVARPRWTDGAAVLLEDVLYAADGDGVSALDVRTGRELWRTPVAASSEVGGGLMTDGRRVLLVARADRLTEAGFTVGAPEDDSARWVGGELAVPPDGGLGLSLAAFDLGSGRPAWATRLPPEVRQVWGHRGDLVGWGDDVTVVLN